MCIAAATSALRQARGVERRGEDMRRTVLLLASLVFVAAGTANALAHGGPTTTTTVTFKDETEVVPGSDCEGNLGAETHVFNGVLHTTTFPDGHSHVSGTMAGTWSLDVTEPSLPDYEGRFVIRFGENLNPNAENFTTTAPFVATGSDGSRFNFLLVIHVTVAGGVVRAEVLKFRCDQG
jgi:hypothetical protein